MLKSLSVGVDLILFVPSSIDRFKPGETPLCHRAFGHSLKNVKPKRSLALVRPETRIRTSISVGQQGWWAISRIEDRGERRLPWRIVGASHPLTPL